MKSYIGILTLLAVILFILFRRMTHPKAHIIGSIAEQIQTIADTSRTFDNNQVYTKPIVTATSINQIVKALKSEKIIDTVLTKQLTAQIEYLQKVIVDQRGTIQSLMTLNQNTKIETKTIVVTDTVNNTKTMHFFDPLWYDITVLSNRQDSALLNATFKNKLGIVQYTEGGQSFVKVINQNPFTTTEQGTNIFVLDKQAEKKPKRFGLGLQIGYGINTQFSLKPQIGIGLQYNFITF